MKQRITIISIAILLLTTTLIFAYDYSSGADNDDRVLFDMGNGETIWVDLIPGDTIDEVLSNTATANGITYSSSVNDITINGKTSETIGGTDTGGSLIVSGTTIDWVTSIWKVYLWTDNGTEYEWTHVANIGDTYSSGYVAVAFYPDEGPNGEDIVPVETPEYMQSWTMIRGDAEQSGEQDPGESATTEAHVEWTDARGGISGVLGSVLYVQGYIFAKFSAGSKRMDPDSEIKDPVLRCYTTSGVLVWEFKYSGIESYETTTPVIVGDYIYMQSGAGVLYRIPWKIGPGDNNDNVVKSKEIPYSTEAKLTGYPYSTGPGSMVFDSGCLFMNSSNGMVYCFDMDLNLIWSSQMGGHTYYLSPTIVDDYIFTGALNGTLYVMKKTNGDIIDSDEVYVRVVGGKKYGSVSSPSVFKDGSEYIIMFSLSDGRGMDSMVGGIGIYSFDGTSLTRETVITDTFGLVSNYLQPVTTSDFTGVYFTSSKGFYRIDTDGNYTLLNDTLYPIKAPPVLVGTSIYLVGYQPGSPIYEMGLDGKIISLYSQNSTVRNYSMSPVLIVNGMLFVGNDAGLIAISGIFPEYIEPAGNGTPWWHIVILIFIIIATLMAAIYAILRFVKGIEKPYGYLKERMQHYIKGDDLRHNTKNRHRLLIVLIAGTLLTVTIFILCLCMGPNSLISIQEMLSRLMSAISKGGVNLTTDELTIYESRLPRTLAALAVGIGLSIAGCMYQAIIRNPLVDPYIMGVSAGAGTAAVAVIAFDFTFFGLFAGHSLYLTALSAIIGGILAFLATMFIAEKAGGSSLNYVLAGVVVGLAFSAVQTLMLSLAGQRVNNALSWLFGSFSNVSWSQLWIILIPAIFLSLVPLLWAKEFNLVLLGEDQAQQMGLNVRRFNRTMLILASVLTAVCVAFVGIIGFVGLVVPHLCRMMLGGDHRLVLPASIAFGGALMMAADLIARIAYYGQELPVGAITTIIGVPVFAYLLIKRGKLYEG